MPKDYAYGFRGPEDKIWGLWEADSFSYQLSANVQKLLEQYGSKLDIIYDDGLTPENTRAYSQLIYWSTLQNQPTPVPPPKPSPQTPQPTLTSMPSPTPAPSLSPKTTPSPSPSQTASAQPTTAVPASTTPEPTVSSSAYLVPLLVIGVLIGVSAVALILRRRLKHST